VLGEAAVLGLLAGCGPREPALVRPGVSTVSAAPFGGAAPARDSGSKWEGANEVAGYRSLGKPFLSRGHFAGRWRAQISANPTAAETFAVLSPSSRFPTGSVLVKAHLEADGAPGPIFAMVKRDAGYFPRGGDWEFVVTDRDGWVEDRGPLASCARCHAEAPADWVFGLPAEARR
jgi:hypothetical protein